ncbi:XdhC family protein [Natrinema salifodinae]|uniref:XdhC family protein n=1 Tax=Natrinema salifodinae TaxID=1202768 RepID=UPI0006795A18|nr:XdhC family protein [Natrinema salifodinae]
MEPLDESYRPVVDARRADDAIGVATVVRIETDVDTSVGDRAYYLPDGGFAGDADLPAQAIDELADPMATLAAIGESETLTVETDEGCIDVFVDGVRPPPELVVFGSGHDVGPVVELATRVDFRTTVVTFRGGRADDDRFPRADAVISASPRELSTLREWDAETYAVVMTHNFLDDRLALDQLLETPIEYIGLMGPEKRFEEMREDFAEEGRTVTDADLERIYTPIGLSLEGDAPYQIAFSIVAELLAVAHDRTPRHLSRRTGPIHDRTTLTEN